MAIRSKTKAVREVKAAKAVKAGEGSEGSEGSASSVAGLAAYAGRRTSTLLARALWTSQGEINARDRGYRHRRPEPDFAHRRTGPGSAGHATSVRGFMHSSCSPTCTSTHAAVTSGSC
jgi:hypothetical protein